MIVYKETKTQLLYLQTHFSFQDFLRQMLLISYQSQLEILIFKLVFFN